MKYRIYISSSLEDSDKAKELASFFKENNFIITCEWWRVKSDNNDFQLGCEMERGVRTADLFILIDASKKSSGKIIEFSLAKNYIPCFVIGGRMTSIFRNKLKLNISDFNEIAFEVLLECINEEIAKMNYKYSS